MRLIAIGVGLGVGLILVPLGGEAEQAGKATRVDVLMPSIRLRPRLEWRCGQVRKTPTGR